ncbi:MAG: HAD family hydrolase [Promethearchaeota archaeon]
MNKFTIKALLIDYDNTLVLFNEDQFLTSYARIAAPYFADLLDENTFFQKLLASTLHMIHNDGSMINVEAFTNHFISDLSQLSYDECYDRFSRFYRESFQELEKIGQTVPEGRQVVKNALNADLQVAIATNPIFPEEAMVHRLKWANLSDLDIDLVTHAENMRYCKPRPEYYQAILENLKRKPDECLMVGNDTLADMAASVIGVKTFLVEIDAEKGRTGLISSQVGRYTRDITTGTKFPIDWRGTLKDLDKILFK